MASLPPTPRLPLPASIAHTTDNRAEDDEYIDYELFTSPDFSPIAFCNSLVLATTTASDAEIDLAPAQQRVTFDLEEVEKLLQKEATQNHTTLLPHAAKINQVSSILTTTQSSLSSVTSSFQRLENEVLKPYNAALPIYTALTKLHATANLLRAVTWFMYLVRQFQGIQTQLAELKQPSANAAAAGGPNDAARLSVRAARSFAEISRHLGNFPRLRSVRVVTELENGVVNVGRK
ncbi:Golgi transport complex subunit 5-domain-containing protein [Lipomyces orientalis]|uniref:Golgi transport complex subunit 5-domain-containing protein n=1 Tax=Lipomyces orientalis TaxID=1233043 RepID=A0ACC3TPS0_9ASCO